MAEFLRAVSRLFDLANTSAEVDFPNGTTEHPHRQGIAAESRTIERLLGVIARSGALTAIECHQILKENDSTTRLEKLFQMLALQDEVRNAEFLKCLRTVGIRAMISDEKQQPADVDEAVVEQLMDCLAQNSKIVRLGKFPLKSLNFCFQRREQKLLYESVEQLFNSTTGSESSSSAIGNNIVWLVGGAGLGTTTLATHVVYDSHFLTNNCRVVQVIWLDMQHLAPATSTPATSMNAIVSELARLLLSPNQVQTLLNDELEPDSPSSILVTQSLIAKINEHILHNVCVLSRQSVLLVVDSVTNQTTLSQIVGSLCPAVRCLAILNGKSNAESVDAVINNNKNRAVRLSKIDDSELTELLAKTLPHSEAERLAAACDGSPLIASLIQSKYSMDGMFSLDLNDDNAAIMKSDEINDNLMIQLLDSILVDNTFWRSFLLFEPGEAVDIGDLMVIWKCSRIEAERYCREFCNKCLIRPLIDGMSSTSLAPTFDDADSLRHKFFCVHSIVFDATLRLAALRQKLTFNSHNLREMRFAIIHSSFLADNGNIESTFHEAVRLGRRKLVDKILSIVESVDYLWKFSDCQLIVLNMADYFYQNAFGFVIEEQNANNENPVFDSGWLQLFSRFMQSLCKDDGRASAVTQSAGIICNRSNVAKAFIRQTFVIAASFEGIELISLFLQSLPLKNYRGSFLIAKEPRLGRTALIMAASKGYTALTRLLVDAGADVSIRDAASKLALTLALEQGHSDVVRILYDETLSLYNQQMQQLRSPSNSPKKDLIVKEVTAEEMLVPLISAALSGKESVTNFVLQRGGIHVNTFDDHHRTALMAATWSNNVSVAKLILDGGAHVNASDEFGKTALSRAVEAGNLAMVKLLLQKGADVNRRDRNGRSAIFFSVESRNLTDDAITRLLLDHGTNLKTVEKHGRTALQVAAWNNRIGAVEMMLEHKDTNISAFVNHKDAQGATALIAAAERGNAQIVQLLLKHGASIDAREENGQTALMKAAEAGHLETCQALLQHSASEINAVDSRHMTALYLAAENGETRVVHFFLENYDADVAIADNEKSTVLHAAVENSYFDITKMLLSRLTAQTIDARDVQGQNAIMMCSYRGDVILTNLLLSTGRIDVNAWSNDGLTPLMMAVKNDHIAVTQLLVESGAAIESRCKVGINALIFTACFGHPVVGRYLLEHGANVNVRDDRGFTPLMISSKNGFFGVVKVLLEYNADPTLRDDNNRTALMRAAANGHYSIVQRLLKFIKSSNDPSLLSSMLEATDKHGKTGLVKAAENGHVGTVKLLLEAGAEDGIASALLCAAANGQSEVVQLLFDSGLSTKDADIMQETGIDALFEAIKNDQEAVVRFLVVVRGVNSNAKNCDGNSVLYLAVSEGHTELARILVEHGAEVNAPAGHGMTPLMAAAKEGHINIVRLLLRNGADVNAVDEHRNTALIIAAKNRHGKIAKLLLDAGANVDMANEWRETALITAVRTEDAALVRHLLERGASINAADQHGYSALLIATWKNNFILVRLLLDTGADIHATDSDGYNGLMIACRNKSVEIGKMLLDRGIDVNAQNSHGYTALMISTLKGDTAFVRMLLNVGADPKITDLNGHSAIDTALKRSNSDLAYLFRAFQQQQE